MKNHIPLKVVLMLSGWLFCGVVLAQQSVSGTVVDTDGTPLIGVNIVQQNTSSGTVTDLDGTYQLTVPGDAVLVISYTGYTTITEAVANRSTINVTMQEGATLDEVVVVGYGREKKSTLTGSVSAINSDQLTAVPVANAANLLSGRVPGVMTRQNSGLPGGEDTQIRIRGFARAPLVLVDGVQMDFSRIDPNDIETITILKDAAAAVYGARAGNGVVLVTTKRGTTGKPKISYNGSYTSQSAVSFQEHVSAGQYVQLVREGDLNDGNGYDFTFDDQLQENYETGAPGFEGGDWIGALIDNNAPMQQHNLSVSGGTSDIKYYTSFGYTDQESYFRTRDFDYNRINARSNIDAQINENLSFNLDLSYREETTNRASNNLAAIWTDLATAQPILPTTLPDPSIGNAYSGFSQRNPVLLTDRSKVGFWDRVDNVFRGKLGGNYKIPFLKGLTIRAEVNVEQLSRATKSFRKSAELYQYLPETDSYSLEGVFSPVSSISDAQFRRTQLYPLVSLEYEKKVGNHSLKLLGIAEQQTRKFSSLSASRLNLLASSIPELFIGSTDQQLNNGNSGADIGRKSVVGRLNYGYKDRYLFEATMRADGNVLFAPETRWGYFPSVSAGWVISEESFFNSSKVVDFLKLRLSYSRLGDDQANGLNGYDYLTGYDLQGRPYLLGDSEGQPRIRTRGLVNPALTWEILTMANIGLEATLFDGKLGVEVDVFNRRREGIININVEDVPSTFGAQLPVVNINSQESRGFEVLLSYEQRIGAFKIDISPNISLARSTWLEVKSQEDFTDPDQQRLFELDGKRVNRFVGYRSDGIFMNQAEIDEYGVIQDGNNNITLRPGDIRYLDLDGDGELTFRDQEEIAFNTGLPELAGGLNLGVTYKNFRLSGLLQGASNFSINISGNARSAFSNSSIPLTYHFEHRWQPDPNNPGVNINPNASLPAITQAPGANNNRVSDFWVKNVNYLRLKNLNLTYALPASILSKIGIGSMDIYVAGENILTTNNLGIFQNAFDPEAQSGNPARTFPITRTIAFGLRASL
ncbi:MAG: SusC/RagA family TonB-linked outer membrane protein [Lewinella sp.]